MVSTNRRRGSFAQRFFVTFLSFILTLLFMWLLNFIVSDIGNIEGPDYQAIKEQYVDASLEDQQTELRDETVVLQRERAEREADIVALKQSMNNAQTVLNELIDLPGRTAAQEEALNENQTIFFARPREIETANSEIRRIDGELRTRGDQMRALGIQINEQSAPAIEEYNELLQSHRFKVASLKLLFLLPVLILAAGLIFKKRSAPWAPIYYALFIAAFFRVSGVAWDYFPAQFFKYIALATAIVIIIAFIIKLIRTVVAPKPEVLLNQNRESYNQRRCPVCAYPIRRGGMKNVVWTRKGPKDSALIVTSGQPEPEEPYQCPSCGEQVFEKCSKCGSIRHSLLPYCESCGDEKPLTRADAEPATEKA